MRYTAEQKEAMMDASLEYYKKIKETGLFPESPSMAHNIVWSMLSALRSIKNNNLDVKTAAYLEDKGVNSWEDL